MKAAVKDVRRRPTRSSSVVELLTVIQMRLGRLERAMGRFSERALEQLDHTHEHLKQLKLQGERLMAKQEDFDAVLASLNEATNEVAAELEALRAEIAGGGLSGEQEAGVLAKLDTLKAWLSGLASDPENPVPEPA